MIADRNRTYSLPDALFLGAVSLQVADLDRSLRYYQTVLGLEVLRQSEGSAALGAKSTGAVLVELHERVDAATVPARGRLGLYHFALLLPDRAALGSFVAHLAISGIRAGMSDHLVSEAVYLTDPDGLGIEVYCDRPSNTWRFSDGQLVMATDVLDAEAVIRAADGVPWGGMPAGSRIGHVHLHVGDIATAAAFYSEALGFKKTVWNYPGALFMSAGGYHHHLGTNTWASGAPVAGAGDARLLHWEIALPTRRDVVLARQSMERAGYGIVSISDGWQVDDPWGTTVRVVTGDTSPASNEVA